MMLRIVPYLLLALFVVSSMSVDVQAQPPVREPQLAHMVFFKTADEPADATTKLVAACKKYLAGHDGVVYFSVGVRAEEMDRDVNDKEFDVALHLVFRNKAAHDVYAEHDRHMKFIEENKELWSSVRVFDSILEPRQPRKRPGTRVPPRKPASIDQAPPK